MRSIKTAAIIGAGMAGLTLARTLQDAGIDVTLYDKGRKPGGRLATRHAEMFSFNHGCQFASAHDEHFRETLLANGAAPWPAAGTEKFAGVPDMASLAVNMAAKFNGALHLHAHISFIKPTPAGWHLSVRDATSALPGLVEPGGASVGPFDAVCLAIPAPQAEQLLNAIPHPFGAKLTHVRIAPCWAVMLGFAAPVSGPEIIKPQNSPISWIARENARPGANPLPVAYTIHASAAWSREHLEESSETIITALKAAFSTASGITATPDYAAAHRWRYALAETPLGEPFLWDEEQKLGVCGDWCLAGKISAAYVSGASLGIRLTS